MTRREFGGLLVLLLVVGAATAAPAWAQSDQERFERQLEQLRLETFAGPEAAPAGQRLLLDYGGYFLFDYLALDDSESEHHVLRQYTVLAYARLNFDDAHELFARARGGWRDFNDGDSFDGRGDERIDPDFDRLYYRFNLANYRAVHEGKVIADNVVVTAGRELVYWANGLTIAQVIDGGMLEASVGRASAHLVAGITPVRTVDFDSSRPEFDFHTRRGFFGGLLSYRLGAHQPYAYGLVQRDYNDDDERLLTGTITTEFEYDSEYFGLGSTGSIGDRMLYGVEFVYETGNSLSNGFRVEPPLLVQVPQTRDDIEAFAADFRLEYLFSGHRRTRVSTEVLLASGDDDRGDTSTTFRGNTPGTSDRAFNAFGLINTGLAQAPAVSNLMMFRAGVSTFPLADTVEFERLQVGLDVFLFGKLDKDAPIDEPTASRRYLAWEPDVFLNWQIMSDVTLAVRYGISFPSGEAFPLDDSRQFFSFSMSFAF
jgi:hypothetical protein